MITASIVTYHNRASDINRVIDCVLRSPIDKLYIIDNSGNDSLRRLEHISPRIRYIHNVNTGYVAHNIAIREAIDSGSEYHIIVNPDIYFEGDVIERLADYMDAYPDVGWVMPRIEYPNGELQYLCKQLPTPSDFILRRFLPPKIMRKSRERFELRHFGYDRELNVPYLSGCFMFLRTEALKKIGLFDERFFMYGEDIDLSRRMHAKYKTIYYPHVTIVHAHEKASYKSWRMMRIHIENVIMYFNKWGWFFDVERRRFNRRLMDSINKSI